MRKLPLWADLAIIHGRKQTCEHALVVELHRGIQCFDTRRGVCNTMSEKGEIFGFEWG